MVVLSTASMQSSQRERGVKVAQKILRSQTFPLSLWERAGVREKLKVYA